MTDLLPFWTRAWADLALPPPAGVQAQLLRAYAEPQRHYHTQQHLAECLALFGEVAGAACQPGEVAVALWFHDAVYDVRSSRNEASSADWAVQVLQSAGAAAPVCERVRALILATRHDAVPEAGDAQLLVDIDLSILGAPPERFAQYERQIRQEYDWVPRPLYVFKRRGILQGFLNRERIYSTEAFHTRLEAQARANLAGALASLRLFSPPC